MAFASLFTLLDDVASVLDDVAAMTKVAAKKTAGIVGDDLAVNANQLTGIAAQRELPVIWQVTKGSFINKVIIIPAVLLISYFSPIMITVLLLIGGAYLAFEGMEKVIHHFKAKRTHASANSPAVEATAATTVLDSNKSQEQLAQEERTKIRGAIRTDFILSAEIIIIAMGVVATMGILSKTLVMIAIGVGITVFVYGVVALIVKLDDMGLWLMQKDATFLQKLGRGMIAFMPKLMHALAIIGTVAMFLVAGGIFSHNWPWLHGLVVAMVGDSFILATLVDLVVGMLVGLAVYFVVSFFMSLQRVETSRLTIDV
ncbi:MAG: DUF808 domain-containing protein [Alcaligenaceae bacterium]|nr:DUF808 domain-containing protein [Alcaligenaceae bacterium]